MAIKRAPKTLKKLIDLSLESSRERLKTAKLLMEKGYFRDSISRSYYAFLDAAEALLLTKDLRPKSHAGAGKLLGLHFVKTEIIDKKYGRWFKKIEKARLEADYEAKISFTKEDAKETFKEALEFVDEVEKLVPRLLQKLKGKYARVPYSKEEFLRERQEEKELE